MAGLETGHETEMNFESALENYLTSDFGDLEEGSITKGEIVRVDEDNVLVDVNFKSEGQIPAAEFRDAAGNMVVAVGDRHLSAAAVTTASSAAGTASRSSTSTPAGRAGGRKLPLPVAADL